MDDSLLDSVFSEGASSDFEPVSKPKTKLAAKKPTTSLKAKPAPAKTKQTTLKGAKSSAPKKRRKPDSDEENAVAEDDHYTVDDNSLLSNTPPSSKRQKSQPGPKKSSGKPLQTIDNESYDLDGADDAKPMKAPANSSEKYQKLTQLEHILKRPDTYIGSVEQTTHQMWVYNSETEMMQMRDVTFVPGLYKIFDEILVNAADNKQNDKSMSEIKVTVDRESGEISVRNDGRGIPIEIHAKEGIYVPELIFGHLLTSSNYDDDQKKVTGGRNGYGAKLCNIFSTSFSIETVDSSQQKKYKQTWTKNMSVMGKAKITSAKGNDYTQVTFVPDYKHFKMTGIDDDFEALMKRRVYDLAGTLKGVKVWLNSVKISAKIKDFKSYMTMYTKALKSEQAKGGDDGAEATETQVILTDKPDERWEIGFAVSDGSFQQVSFVNSIATTSGGTHVNYVADQIVNKLVDVVKKKNKGGVALKNNQIRNHIFLFVNCLIDNPAFTSQTKEQLTTKSSKFGSKCSVSEGFLKKIANTEAVNNIIHFAQQKADQVLKKSDGNRRSRMNHAKLTDANKAGTKDGWRCTLILTEGDSASLLALAGRAVVNPDLIGVFPLRGKLLNVRDASIDQISKNAEIQNIKKFLGLQHKKEYKDARELRYGHLMIMTDQDHDGSHIKGLLINFLQVQFPSLLKIEGFLMEFITPIVKVWKGDIKKPTKMHSFFTMPEYEEWRQQPGNKNWEKKYFKGLGTSSTQDAQVYFRDLDRHLKEFHTMKEEEAQLIDLAFSKKKADARKEWLRDFVPGTYLDLRVPKISYDDFVNKELILFSMADNFRSIPSVIDGFKPGQRKVIYTCFKRNLSKKEVKVLDLAGSVNGLTEYAYGDASLQQTIIAMAQNFVGSNNINCLEPSGNFGSRLQGGSDAASARYTFTRLSPFARKIFHPADDAVLEYQETEDKKVEPDIYVPVLPMLLVNGTDGIGTGWSSTIPNYKPEDIVDNLKRRMAGESKEDMLPMTPWFRGFTGQTEDIGDNRFKFTGRIRQTGNNEVEITELPVRMWTQDFKEKLEEIMKNDKVPSFIKDYIEYNTPDNVHFIIKMDDKHMQASLGKGLEEAFKLYKTVSTTNLVAFDAQGRIHKYATVLDMLEEFYHIRLRYYEKRKQHLLDEMQKELEKMTNQARFIKMIIDGALTVSKKKKAVLVAELKKLKFKPFPKKADAKKAGETEEAMEDDDEVDDGGESGINDFDYLLGMAIWSLTQEKIDKLKSQIGDKEAEIDKLIQLAPKDLWNNDLDEFLEEWQLQLNEERVRAKKIANLGRRASAKLRVGGGAVVGKSRKKKSYDSDGDSDSDFGPVKSKKAAPKQNALTNFLSISAPPPSQGSVKESVPAAAIAIEPLESVLSAMDGVEEEPRPKKTTTSSRGRPPKAVARKDAKTKVVDLSDEEDVFAEIAKDTKATALPSRHARATTKKPVKYALSDESDSDNGDSLLGDVTNMVKGISNGTSKDASGASRPLFSASVARPSSSQGRQSMKPTSRKPTIDLSDDDETDYTKLVPQPSPQRPAARTANDTILSGDSDDEFGFGLAKSKPQPAAAFTAPAPKPAPKPKAVPRAQKPAAAAKVKSAAPAPAGKKSLQLSPAAKAYAAKRDKTKSLTGKLPSSRKARDPTSSDASGDDVDVDAIAGELLSDEESGFGDSKPRKEAAAAKPEVVKKSSRRAAAAKAKYVLSEESEEEASEAEFDESTMMSD